MQLFPLTHNPGNFLRRLVLPGSVRHWLLTTLREKLINIGARVARRAEYAMYQRAELAVPLELVAAILDGVQRFSVPRPLIQRR